MAIGTIRAFLSVIFLFLLQPLKPFQTTADDYPTTILANEIEQEYSVLENLRKETNAHALAACLCNLYLPLADRDYTSPDLGVGLSLKKQYVTISLGCNCAGALSLEIFKISEAFFPFDWCISPIKAIHRAIESNFKDYLKRENLKLTGKSHGRCIGVEDQLYGIRFIHDFKKDLEPLSDYQAVQAKMLRRIDRFNAALNSGKPIYFFRTKITKAEAIGLRNVISRKFPKLIYTLVVLNDLPIYRTDWKERHIKNFFVKDILSVGYKHVQKEWGNVFKKLGFVITNNLKSTTCKPMPLQAKIYVAGHKGLVGSALVRALEAAGYKNLVVRTSSELDLCNQQAVHDFFKKERPEYVFLAAAKVGGILANNTYRGEFIYKNMMIAANVIDAAHKYGVRKLINLGSSCIYPKQAPQPMKEEYLLTGPLEVTNEPYAVAKIAAIKLCDAYNHQYGTNFISAMPTNLYGINDNFNFETSHVLPALIRKIHLAKLLEQDDLAAIVQDVKKHSLGYGLDALIDQNDSASVISTLAKIGVFKHHVTVWGTGNPMREFLHVDDLAQALIFLMQNYDASMLNECINVGVGTDISLRYLALLIKDIVGFKGELRFDTNKPDGTLKKLLDVSYVNSLGWKAQIALSDGIKGVYDWYINQFLK